MKLHFRLPVWLRAFVSSGSSGEEIVVTVQFKKTLASCVMLVGLLGVFGAGCSPEGAGSIKIENPDAVRAKFAGEGAGTGKPLTTKEAAAKALVEEAGKKHPKLK
jgi:hypothetical protein